MKQLVYVITNLKKILRKQILLGANSKFLREQILSLKNRKTTILNSQNIRMLQIHVNNDIYDKYCLIHNNRNFYSKCNKNGNIYPRMPSSSDHNSIIQTVAKYHIKAEFL